MDNHSVNITPFKFKHLHMLLELHQSQNYEGVANITMRTLPKIGYIAIMNGHPIAAGFLRRLEPCFAQIDTLVSNGHFGSKIRHEGIKLVVDSLIEEAKRLKLEGIVAHTKDRGIIERAHSIGFHDVSESIIALPLLKP